MFENEQVNAAVFAVVFLVFFSWLGHNNKQCGTNVVVNTTAPTAAQYEQETGNQREYETVQQVSNELSSSTSFMLAEAERIAGFNFRISDACRTKSENKALGGAKFSTHVADQNGICYGVDIAFSSTKERDKIIAALKEAGFERIGAYSNHIHADNKVNDKIYKQVSWKGGKSK